MIEERARQRLPCVSGLRVSQRRNYSILVWNETSLRGFRKASKRRYGNVRSPNGREVADAYIWYAVAAGRAPILSDGLQARRGWMPRGHFRYQRISLSSLGPSTPYNGLMAITILMPTTVAVMQLKI
jgi:hypothetical protein